MSRLLCHALSDASCLASLCFVFFLLFSFVLTFRVLLLLFLWFFSMRNLHSWLEAVCDENEEVRKLAMTTLQSIAQQSPNAVIPEATKAMKQRERQKKGLGHFLHVEDLWTFGCSWRLGADPRCVGGASFNGRNCRCAHVTFGAVAFGRSKHWRTWRAKAPCQSLSRCHGGHGFVDNMEGTLGLRCLRWWQLVATRKKIHHEWSLMKWPSLSHLKCKFQGVYFESSTLCGCGFYVLLWCFS